MQKQMTRPLLRFQSSIHTSLSKHFNTTPSSLVVMFDLLSMQEDWIAAKKKETASKSQKKEKGKAAASSGVAPQKSTAKEQPGKATGKATGKAGDSTPKPKKQIDPTVRI